MPDGQFDKDWIVATLNCCCINVYNSDTVCHPVNCVEALNDDARLRQYMSVYIF